MSYTYKAQIIDDETDEVITEVSGHSEESMLEETGKLKWTGAVEWHEKAKANYGQEELEDNEQ